MLLRSFLRLSHRTILETFSIHLENDPRNALEISLETIPVNEHGIDPWKCSSLHVFVLEIKRWSQKLCRSPDWDKNQAGRVKSPVSYCTDASNQGSLSKQILQRIVFSQHLLHFLIPCLPFSSLPLVSLWCWIYTLSIILRDSLNVLMPHWWTQVDSDSLANNVLLESHRPHCSQIQAAKHTSKMNLPFLNQDSGTHHWQFAKYAQ